MPAEHAHVVGGHRLSTKSLCYIGRKCYILMTLHVLHHAAVIHRAYLPVLGDERCGESLLWKGLRNIDVPIHVQERLRLHGVGLYLGISPML